jgi:predicted lipoprotein with Yx(FWY)xxD motif
MTLRSISVLAAVAATLVVAGCGGSTSNSSDTAGARNAAPAGGNGGAYDYGTPAATPAAKSQTGATPTVKAVKGDLGTMLVDGQGRTLYLWEADKGVQSVCDGACAQAWPPLTTKGKPAASDGVKGSLLGTAKRSDGTLGVTYAGHPLYHYAGDAGAGQANGQGSDGFGAKWWVVSPAGAAIQG